MLLEKNLLLMFSVNDCSFAIDVKDLVEVAENLVVSSGCELESCIGEVVFRGESVPVANINEMLAFGGKAKTKGINLIVKVENVLLSIPVDSVAGVAEIKGRIIPFPDVMLKESGLYSSILDYDGEFILVFDLKVLFSNILEAVAAKA